MVTKSSTKTSTYPEKGSDGNDGSLSTGVCRFGKCLAESNVGIGDVLDIVGVAVGAVPGLVLVAIGLDMVGMAVGLLVGFVVGSVAVLGVGAALEC